jgi:pyruvate dehydrogenase E2 component (dihydrolipoamide acetyltransferase)
MFVFNFPDVGEGIHEGRVVEWLVAEGDSVAEDQALLKVETDKAVVELPSPHTGTVLKLHAAAEAAIFVGDPLVTIGSSDEELPEDTSASVDPPIRGPVLWRANWELISVSSRGAGPGGGSLTRMSSVPPMAAARQSPRLRRRPEWWRRPSTARWNGSRSPIFGR